MSYDFEIEIVGHPKDEKWFHELRPLNSNLSDVIHELWGLESETHPGGHYPCGDHEFEVSGTVFVNYIELHRPDFLVDGYLHELIAAIKKSKSPDRVKLSIVVEHP